MSDYKVCLRGVSLVVLVLLLSVDASAQKQTISDDVLVVRSIEYEVTGRTRDWALADLLDLEAGQTFENESDLTDYLANQKQLLLNQRVLQTADLSYRIHEKPVEGQLAVDITVTIQDTWNILVLPYVKYDSNTGLLLSLRGRDYNILGTLQELEVNLDYERTEEEENIATLSGNFNIPIRLFQQRWILSLDQAVEWYSEDWESRTNIGLGYQFNWVGQEWTVKYTQGHRAFTDDPEGDGYYLTSRVDLGAAFALTSRLPVMDVVTFKPNAYVHRNYRPGGISEDRFGSVFGFTPVLSAGRVDWIGNFRRGFTASISNNNSYVAEELDWSSSVRTEIATYQTWGGLGLTGRVSGFYLFDGAGENQNNAAADARGVLNDTMQGNLGLFSNLDVMVRTWTLRPLFEMQTGAFFDVALVTDTLGTVTGPAEDQGFTPDQDIRFGSGIEIVGFPLFARSLYMRGSIGFDLRKVAAGEPPLESDVREIFIGLGHHY